LKTAAARLQRTDDRGDCLTDSIRAALAASALLVVAASAAAQPAAAASGVAAKPMTSFDLSAFDRSADPCADFYQFACGGWVKSNPLPPDQSRYGRFDELQERNRDVLHGILEKVAPPAAGRDATDQKIGDYYAACMDEPAIEALGLKPLEAPLARVAAVSDRGALAAVVASLHRSGASAFFSFDSTQDFKDPTQVIAEADRGGMGLPDRDYYLKDDPNSQQLRTEYVAHVQRIFELAGEPKEKAAADAQGVMAVETALAKGALDRTSRRDPSKVYHKVSRQQLEALAPGFGWTTYLGGIGVEPGVLNVTEPEFFKTMNTVLEQTSLEALKTYLRWHLLHVSAPMLPKAFVDENFAFFGRTLTGAKEIKPRWNRCVQAVDSDLGEALGKRYVELTFGPEGKQRTGALVAALEKALDRDIRELPWMTEDTKKQALAKLSAIANKVGSPDEWRDYSAYEVRRDDALGNSLRGNAFEFERQLRKIGKPVDRKEWRMSPPTVNAYYSPLMNDINFPAGILQPPFFDKTKDDGVNYGAIGAVIGHELTHGFDDQGRQFAADGSLRDWWTPTDAKEFERRAQCFVDEYSGFTAVEDVKLNGRLTLGENTADNGGVRIALMALEQVLAGKTPQRIDGFTPEQRLFVGWAQVWCQNVTPEASRLRAATDPHSPGRWRVNGVLSNMPEFRQAFSCPAQAPMVRANACRVW
jgi:putative endopeptidase